jgi:hypothetical protein
MFTVKRNGTSWLYMISDKCLERGSAIYWAEQAWQLGIRIIGYRHRKRTIFISIHVSVLTAFHINTHEAHGDFIQCTLYCRSSHTHHIQKVDPCYFPPSRETCCKNGKFALQNYATVPSYKKTWMFPCSPPPPHPPPPPGTSSIALWRHALISGHKCTVIVLNISSCVVHS